VPAGTERDAAVEDVTARTGASRWFPAEGGHGVLILFEGGAYDRSCFALAKGAWDHEHCKRCSDRIESMTLCWVTDGGPHVLLCEECYRLVAESGGSGGA